MPMTNLVLLLRRLCQKTQKGFGLWDLCECVIVHTILPPSPVILWIELGGKPKWLPFNSGYHDVRPCKFFSVFLVRVSHETLCGRAEKNKQDPRNRHCIIYTIVGDARKKVCPFK